MGKDTRRQKRYKYRKKMAPGSAKNKRMAEQSDANNVVIG